MYPFEQGDEGMIESSVHSLAWIMYFVHRVIRKARA